jgi:phosphatidylserine/phosphatidylglycerophosphate/cardiolipin synthase-like enzyme
MLTDILRLSDRELDQLLSALTQGTIEVDSGLPTLRRAGFLDHGSVVRSWLSEASSSFGSKDGMIAALRLVRAERVRAARAAPHVELVLSGPATGNTSSRDTVVVVREIFESARQSVLIVGYAFYGSDSIFEPLARRMSVNPSLAVRLIVNIHPDRHRSRELIIRKYIDDFLRLSWPFQPRPAIYYLPGSLELSADFRSSVHAKLIVADQETVYLGSANFTTAAFHRNIEAGLRFRHGTLARQLTTHFDQMIHSGVISPLQID